MKIVELIVGWGEGISSDERPDLIDSGFTEEENWGV